MVGCRRQGDQVLMPDAEREPSRTHGGPAPSVTKAAIGVSGDCLTRDRKWLAGRLRHLQEAERALEQAEQALRQSQGWQDLPSPSPAGEAFDCLPR